MVSVGSLINVQISLAAAAAAGQNLTNLLCVTSNLVVDLKQRLREYTSSAAVAVDFGENGLEYAAAVLAFAQTPQISNFYVGRWAQNAAQGQLIGAPLTAAQQAIANFTAVGADGGFSISIDGAGVEHIAEINLSAVVTLQGVAGAITTALAGAAVCTLLGGAASESGSYVVQGQVAESALACATLFDSQFGNLWYALMMPSITNDADHMAVFGYCQSSTRKHFYGATTSEAGVLVPTYTTDLAYMASQAGFTKGMVQYSSTTDVFIDTVIGADNFAVDLQTALFGAFTLAAVAPGKIGFTDAGMHVLVTATIGVCDEYATNGFLGASGTWPGGGFGSLKTGQVPPFEGCYYVYAAPVATATQQVKQSRMAVPIQVAGLLAGAINTAAVLVTLVP
jgi:hypothetical protein